MGRPELDRSTMIRIRPAITKYLPIFLVFIASACSPAPTEEARAAQAATQTPLPVSTQTPQPTQEGYVTSAFYGYSLKLPEGWNLTRPATMLMAPGQIPWAGETDAVDTFRGPERKEFMVIGARSVGASTTLEVWAKVVAETTTSICQEEPSTENTTDIGGERAMVVVDGDCQGIEHLWLALLHEGLGYQIVWAGPDQDAFEEVQQSFTFTP